MREREAEGYRPCAWTTAVSASLRRRKSAYCFTGTQRLTKAQFTNNGRYMITYLVSKVHTIRHLAITGTNQSPSGNNCSSCRDIDRERERGRVHRERKWERGKEKEGEKQREGER